MKTKLIILAILLSHLSVYAVTDDNPLSALRKFANELQEEVQKADITTKVENALEDVLEDALETIQEVREKRENSSSDVDENEIQSISMELPQMAYSSSNQTIEHFAYTVNYNHEWNIPNWVAYSLTRQETTGDVPRESGFSPDPKVKGDLVVTKDYSHSGYDRGHMAPAADMKWSEQAMRESFYMTNICPQNQNLNRGDWNDLEELARDWARKYGNIYIACGPIVYDENVTIGNNHRIVVPTAFYKVFLRKHNSSWTSIGFMFENEAGNKPLMTYMTSVDDIENITGIDFFYNLPDSIEERIESDFLISDWTL